MKRKITIEVDIEPMSEMAARDAGINGASECFNSTSRLGECWTYPDGAKIWKPTESLSEAAKRYWRNNCELKYKSFMDSCWDVLMFPTVSYIKENKDIKYNPTFDANGHDYVEIAGIKWATVNIGAKSITDYGKYFQWGDTQGYTADQVGTGEGKKEFVRDWSDYTKFTTDGGQSFTKYNSTDGYKELTLDDDAVNKAWGGSWRMPTKEDINTVYDAIKSSAVTANWTSGYNGTSVAGYEIHDKNSNDTLFLPACGFAYDGAVHYSDVCGDYWLSSLDNGGVSHAYGLSFGSDDTNVGDGYRCLGLCVRGVLADK